MWCDVMWRRKVERSSLGGSQGSDRGLLRCGSSGYPLASGRINDHSRHMAAPSIWQSGTAVPCMHPASQTCSLSCLSVHCTQLDKSKTGSALQQQSGALTAAATPLHSLLGPTELPTCFSFQSFSVCFFALINQKTKSGCLQVSTFFLPFTFSLSLFAPPGRGFAFFFLLIRLNHKHICPAAVTWAEPADLRRSMESAFFTSATSFTVVSTFCPCTQGMCQACGL